MPKVQIENEDSIKKLAEGGRMNAFSDLELIGSIVEKYPVYTFNQVWEMELDFINNITLTNYERAMYTQRFNQYERIVNKPHTK